MAVRREGQSLFVLKTIGKGTRGSGTLCVATCKYIGGGDRIGGAKLSSHDGNAHVPR
jgi:hypothetical protein